MMNDTDDKRDLKKALATIGNNFDLVYSNWVLFGSSGLIQQPSSIRESFIRRCPQLGGHQCTKWICRTSCMTDRDSIEIHKIHGVDSRRVMMDNDVFRLNHYPIQSLDFFCKVKH